METTRIVAYGNDILRRKADRVDEVTDEIRDLIEMMYRAMAEHNGVGVAGPQVGASKRLFVYDVGEGHHALINPEIVRSSGKEWAAEACLSLPGLQGEVPRFERITVTGIDENGKKVRIKAEGFLARVFQHEMDHLEGMLFIDRADPDSLETVPVNEPADEDEAEE